MMLMIGMLRRMRDFLYALPRDLLLALVRGYRLLLKPWLGNACRFEPSCSQYALTALQRHGALKGGGLTAYRILRCHPWCDGGLDPVPERKPSSTPDGLFSRLGLPGTRACQQTNPVNSAADAPAPARAAYREPAS